MNFALLVLASDKVAEVGALRHLFDETSLKAPQPAEPSCPSQAVTIELKICCRQDRARVRECARSLRERVGAGEKGALAEREWERESKSKRESEIAGLGEEGSPQ